MTSNVLRKNLKSWVFHYMQNYGLLHQDTAILDLGQVCLLGAPLATVSTQNGWNGVESK